MVLPEEFKALEQTKSIYLHGKPGTGKTFLMDMLYNEIPLKNKVRLHYAEFMLQIHQDEHKINQKKDRSVDTISQVGNNYCRGIDLLCIDEFQVLHISDAMILKRLFEAFIENNMICILTSNRPPSDLYLGGLQRFLFMPFIEMIYRRMKVVSLEGVDYRTKDRASISKYNKERDDLWKDMVGDQASEIVTIKVAHGRTLTIPKYKNHTAMMSFYDLCGKPLGNSDYIGLCKNIHTLILTDVPILSLDRRDYLRRFIWLIDELYNFKIRLFILPHIPVYEDQGVTSTFDENFAFERTESRLIEMLAPESSYNKSIKEKLAQS